MRDLDVQQDVEECAPIVAPPTNLLDQLSRHLEAIQNVTSQFSALAHFESALELLDVEDLEVLAEAAPDDVKPAYVAELQRRADLPKEGEA